MIDCTGGLSRDERAIARRNKRESLISSGSDGRRKVSAKLQKTIDKMMKVAKDCLANEAAEAAWAARLFSLEHPDRVVSSTPFQEKEFGDTGSPDKALQVSGVTKDITPDLSAIVVSLALFDGDKMLFAISGVAVPPVTTKLRLSRFVTSARLVVEYNKNRNLDDKLRIDVCLPDNTHMDGFLGLYDKDIAIVTSCGTRKSICRVDLDLQTPLPSDGKIIAAARAFESGRLMVTSGHLTEGGLACWTQITEAALGGPLVDHEGKFLGVNLNIDTAGSSLFLPLTALRERLVHFQILTPKTMDFRGYSLPAGVSSIIPSGFWKKVKQLEWLGYPKPPPLVLEFNGKVLNSFEEEFGQLLAWKEYPFDVTDYSSREYVWPLLPRDVVTKISRSVVRLVSSKGSVRSFACTGLLIKWPGTEGMHPVILTSASLVRSRDDHFNIDNNLKIEVFLPPKQVAKGTLVFYHLISNIAIISLEKGFHCIRPFDICCKEDDLSKPVVAIGRQISEGFLMATEGEVISNRFDTEYLLGCRSRVLASTCRIKKAGIGGPLINFDGAFVGMNHYNERKETLFVPRREIVKILKKELNWRKRRLSMNTLHGVGCGIYRSARWSVPEPYYGHGLLDVDKHALLHQHIGRQLQ